MFWRAFSIVFLFLLSGIFAEDVSISKRRMIELLKSRGIHDKKVLEAMSRVKRELFVLPDYKSQAYEDGPLPIGEGQTISQPYIVAYMTQELQLKGTEKVLEIGFGSGYQTAILAEIANEVYSIEINPKIYEFGRKNLEPLNYKNVSLKLGDGRTGWKDKSPFDAILVAAAPVELPRELEPQLKEGGRMVIPIGELSNQSLITFVKRKGRLVSEQSLPVRFVPLTGGK